MSYYEKEYKRRSLFKQGSSALLTLIAINLIVFVAFAFVQAIFLLKSENSQQAVADFNTNVINWLSLPADLHKMGTRPWTIITHMFLHTGLWHIFGNMLWLWLFGYILQDLTGNRKIFPVFLYGGLAGALAFVLAFNLSPALRPDVHVASALGASAGIMAIAVATTFIAPAYRIFPMLGGGIPLWIITTAYVIIDLATIPSSNTGGHLAHLAGAATGFLFMYSFRRGYDWSEWMNNLWDWFANLFNPDKPKKGKLVKQELFYKSTAKPFKKTPNVTEQRVNEILDKISQKGFSSLSEEEKDLLKRASQDS
ncbi:MAG TPA: rhomboid family intramembrane serine protease [Chitinophagaceae bacterium]|nr:rhomboid family intramembrane serine protease [Chitinophagaceae bacterium]